jgi:pyridoxamine 5'-phosphate oxidase family protein
MNILKSRKYKNVVKNNKIAFVVDDLRLSMRGIPGIRIYIKVDTVTHESGYMTNPSRPQAQSGHR